MRAPVGDSVAECGLLDADFKEFWRARGLQDEFSERIRLLIPQKKRSQGSVVRRAHVQLCKEKGIVWRVKKSDPEVKAGLSRAPIRTIYFIADNLTPDTVAEPTFDRASGTMVLRAKNPTPKLVGKAPSPAAANLLAWVRSHPDNAREFWKTYNARTMARAAAHDGEEEGKPKELEDARVCIDGVALVGRLAAQAALSARAPAPDGLPSELELSEVDIARLLKECECAAGDVEDGKGGLPVLDADVRVDGQSVDAPARADAAVQSESVSGVGGVADTGRDRVQESVGVQGA